MIFSRKTDDALASLVKKIDAVVAENKDQQMQSFVTFIGADSETLEPAVQEFAEKNGVEETPLTIGEDQPDGPASYKLNKDAAYTILMYTDPMQGVVVNHAVPDGELSPETIEAIVQDAAKILN